MTDQPKMLTRAELTRWTAALRENPNKQGTGCLRSEAEGEGNFKFCCLGMACEVFGVPRAGQGYSFDGGERENGYLSGSFARKIGHYKGDFAGLGMPLLKYGSRDYCDVAAANDRSVPWSVIAEHLDKHYPCSDERKVENPNG
jgi:hypothetical protein